MSLLSRLTAVALLPVAIAAGAVSMTGMVVQPAHAGDGTRCEIRVSRRGGMTTLEGVVMASGSITGSYRLSVTSSGRGGGSDIDQSGDFSARPGEPASLGVVSLGGGGAHTADLTVRWNGGSHHCSQRVGGQI